MARALNGRYPAAGGGYQAPAGRAVTPLVGNPGMKGRGGSGLSPRSMLFCIGRLRVVRSSPALTTAVLPHHGLGGAPGVAPAWFLRSCGQKFSTPTRRWSCGPTTPPQLRSTEAPPPSKTHLSAHITQPSGAEQMCAGPSRWARRQPPRGRPGVRFVVGPCLVAPGHTTGRQARRCAASH